MKPSPLRIHRPTTIEDTLELLAAHGCNAKIIAGGQSLVPVLNMRLAAPENLIDITGLHGLDTLEVSDGGVNVGALVTHRRLERDPAVTSANSIIGEALRFVAHPAIRNRGTTVGSIAHADPNGEMPMILALTGGWVEVRSVRGSRTISTEDLNIGPLETCIEPDELITRAVFPVLRDGQRAGFDELARRSGDYGLAGVGMILSTDTATMTGLRVGFISVTDIPEILDLEQVVAGTPLTEVTTIIGAVTSAVKDFIDPEGDIHASGDYRRHLTGVIAERLLKRLGRQKTDAANTATHPAAHTATSTAEGQLVREEGTR